MRESLAAIGRSIGRVYLTDRRLIWTGDRFPLADRRQAVVIPLDRVASLRFEKGFSGRAVWIHRDDGKIFGFTVGSLPFLLLDQPLPFLASRLLANSDRTQEWHKMIQAALDQAGR